MSDGNGLFEHATGDTPNSAHGYCVDDVARGLIAIAREPDPSHELVALATLYLRFIVEAQSCDGRFRNRMDTSGHWTDSPSISDAWGRAMWALGETSARMPGLAPYALAAFEIGAQRRSPHLHAACFAALGAAEVLRTQPEHAGARRLLRFGAKAIRLPGNNPVWPWPEPKLRYANAVIPQTLLLGGHLLEMPRWVDSGLAMLEWLVERETRDGHLSVTPAAGWGPHEPRPGFDQQPIEVATLADAARTAFDITRDHRWIDVIAMCGAWFDGDNDIGMPMTDASRSGGYDGLHATGRNANRGAESTLAVITTFQHLAQVEVAA